MINAQFVRGRRINMIVNFNEEEAIITYDGLQIVIQEDKAKELAHRILDYFEEGEERWEI